MKKEKLISNIYKKIEESVNTSNKILPKNQINLDKTVVDSYLNKIYDALSESVIVKKAKVKTISFYSIPNIAIDFYIVRDEKCAGYEQAKLEGLFSGGNWGKLSELRNSLDGELKQKLSGISFNQPGGPRSCISSIEISSTAYDALDLFILSPSRVVTSIPLVAYDYPEHSCEDNKRSANLLENGYVSWRCNICGKQYTGKGSIIKKDKDIHEHNCEDYLHEVGQHIDDDTGKFIVLKKCSICNMSTIREYYNISNNEEVKND